MFRILFALFALSAAVPITGCTGGVSENQNALTLGAIGTGLGAVIGSAVAPGNPVAGAVIGGAIGGTGGLLIGRQLDADSARRRQEALQRAAATPTQTANWTGTGKDSDMSGQVKFQSRPTTTAQGQTCAIVQETVTIGGQPQQADRQTCRNPDGTWS